MRIELKEEINEAGNGSEKNGNKDEKEIEKESESESESENKNELNEKVADILIDVQDSNWTKSGLILCGKIFTVVGKYEEKVKILCLLCPSKPNVFLSADLSTPANLKTHINVCIDVIQTDVQNLKSIVKNKPKRRQIFASKNVQSSSKERQTVLPFGGKLVYCRIDQKQFDEKEYIHLAIECQETGSSLGRHIFSEADEVYAKIKTDLSQQAFLCTTADVWSTKHRSFMGVTVHWSILVPLQRKIGIENFVHRINESTIKRQIATLACSRFKGAHTYTKVAEILCSIHRKFVISRPTIIATVTDNGANFAKCFKEFGVIIPFVDNVGIDEDNASGETDINDEQNEDDAEFCNSCLEVDEDYLIEPLPNNLRYASHNFSLTCTTDLRTALKGSFFKLYHSVLGKCSALWDLSGRPKSAETINNIFQCQLILPCPTRWNSLYDSVLLLT
ncbi:hypothetical protein Avbf_02575 [Armadillidium vulgare]|nr:hypothetical protein Avbf_02575 [Armadillidium vulgare]